MNATNVVEKATISTGDVEVVNTNVTYVSRDFLRDGEDRVRIRQTANAVSGDAIAGQVIAVQAERQGCTNVLIRATNTVVDSELRTGNATAINRNLVLVDPGISSSDLEIKVRQKARARSGEAIAGQVIGASVGGDGCSSVQLDAQNTVLDTTLLTGETLADNENVILTCAEIGCEAELFAALGKVDEVEVCSADGCEDMPATEVMSWLNPPPFDPLREIARVRAPDPVGSLVAFWSSLAAELRETDNDPAEGMTRKCRRWLGSERRQAKHTPPPGCVTPPPAPAAAAETQSAPTPTPTPTPTPRPEATPAPPVTDAQPDSGPLA